MDTTPLPYKPSDWVQDGAERVAQVKAVYRYEGEVLLDLVLFKHNGDKIGRDSPACGGPRTFEPACSSDGWRRISTPDFPMSVLWVREGEYQVARYYGGPTLPPANWTPRKRTPRYVRQVADDKFRNAIKQIADGHNDARQLAKETLKGR